MLKHEAACELRNSGVKKSLPRALRPVGEGVLTSNQLEGAAEYIQGAYEQVEEAQEKKEFPNPLENAENLPFGVSLCGGKRGRRAQQLASFQLGQRWLLRELMALPSTTTGS